MNSVKGNGFTLVEMIVVVSIILIISSIAVPVTIKQMNKSTERKYLIEAKIIESAVEMYNSEMTSNKIKDLEKLYSVKMKLTTGSKKYITSWPSKLKIKLGNSESEITNEELNMYTLDNILKYIYDKESKYY